jgi:hypothetical protein
VISTSIGTPVRAFTTPPNCQPPSSRSTAVGASFMYFLALADRKIVERRQVEAVADIEIVAAAVGREIEGIAGGVGFVAAARIADAVRPAILRAQRQPGGVAAIHVTCIEL